MHYSFVCISCSGLVSHSDLDDRAIEALKEFNEEGALQVLLQFKDSDLSHVQVGLYRRAFRTGLSASFTTLWLTKLTKRLFYKSFIGYCIRINRLEGLAIGMVSYVVNVDDIAL